MAISRLDPKLIFREEYEPYYRRCESPAEEAFLKGMIQTYFMLPSGNALRDIRNPGLLLEMQVEVENYRLDFVIDKWLAVEIDGATYHSPAEAVKKDLTRDDRIRSAGLDILRIPAKVVLERPEEAAGRVKSRLTTKPEPKAPEPRKRFSLIGALNSVADFVIGVGNYSSLASAREGGGLEAPDRAFYLERETIGLAVTAAEESIRTARYRGQSAEHARWYDDAHGDQVPKTGTDSFDPTVSIPKFMSPLTTRDKTRDVTITRGFQILSEQRLAYFHAEKEKLRKDPRLAQHVRFNLQQYGQMQLWEAIAP